jgi:dCMP deaminase
MTRPSEDEYLLAVARVVATRSTCSRLQVGAVLARDGRILSTGRNGAPSGLPHCSHPLGSDTPCSLSCHAEANALVFAARHGVATEGAHMLLTHAPCLPCSLLLINGGVRRVAFGERYRDYAGVQQLRAAGIEVEQLCPF